MRNKTNHMKQKTIDFGLLQAWAYHQSGSSELSR